MAALRGSVHEHGKLHELLLRCALRDEAALAEYYQLTSPFLNAVVSRRLESEHDVESALVRLYVAIWHEAGSYANDRGKSVWAWTMMILDQAMSEPTARDDSRARVARA